jgi:hypothetical protein
MRSQKHCSLPNLLLTTFALTSVIGCDRSDSLSSPTALQLQDLATVYIDYAVAKGAGPANEQQLRKHVGNVPAFLMVSKDSKVGTATPNYVSKRDGEPFVIRYGVGFCPAEGDDAPVIACERSGKDGTRLVAYANGEVACLDEVAARELMHGNF